MIRFGLRLTLGGGREALVRLLVTAAAVAMGVGLLLTTLAAINATKAQNHRYGWFNTGIANGSAQGGGSKDPLLILTRGDQIRGRLVGRVDVAPTGPDAPVTPGVPQLPGPGEYYASPALAKLLDSPEGAEIGDRYGSHRVGIIGNSGLPGPDSLVALVGRTPDQLAGAPGVRKVTAIADVSPDRCSTCQVGTNSNGMALILSVATGALVFPVVILIGTATRLSATQREQRFAAMRLVGATPRQISVVSAVESTVSAVGGVAIGFLVFLLLRGPMTGISFTGTRFFASDLSLGAGDVLAVVIGVPVAAAVAARLALRRVTISPLGVTRRVTPRPPRAWRVIPLLLGIAELTWFVGRRPPTTDGQVAAYLTGFMVIMVGLLIAGPWLTMAGARLMAERTSRPATLIAARRLADNPKVAFRAVSGLVLALFVATVTLGVITTEIVERGIPAGPVDVANVLTQDYSQGYEDHAPAAEQPRPSDALLTELRSTPGVFGVMLIHSNPLGTKASPEATLVGGLVSCAELADLHGVGRCAPGAEVVTTYASMGGWDEYKMVWSAAAIAADQVRDLPITSIVVSTDGSHAAIEHVRTVLTLAYPGQKLPWTFGEMHAAAGSQLEGFKQLANVVLLASLPIAGCSLAVSVAGGLTDRKRPFSLLRLTGVPLRMLRRVVGLESAVPLLVVAVVAIGIGFLASELFVKSEMGYRLAAPGAEYYVIVAVGIAASLGIIAATLPVLRRITGPETARND